MKKGVEKERRGGKKTHSMENRTHDLPHNSPRFVLSITVRLSLHKCTN